MNNIKCFLFRLYLLTYSPLFPIILTLVIFMTYRIYFEPVLLCDDNGYHLFQLKTELTTETANYRTAVIKCEEFNDLKEQYRVFKQIEPNYNNPDAEKNIYNNLTA